MIDLGLNQYKIKEIKYEVKEGKTVIFKLRNFNLEDVEVEENIIKEDETIEEKIEECEKCEKPKELHDYEPFSCLKAEKGMQETLDASRKGEWKEDVIARPSKPTPTGNAIIKEDKSNLKESITGYSNKNNYTKSNLAESEEVKAFKVKELNLDNAIAKNYKNKIDNLNKKYNTPSKEERTAISREIIKKMAENDSGTIKERNIDRNKEEYFREDPNDDYSKIKSFGDIDTDKTEFMNFLKDKQYMYKMPKEYLEELAKNSFKKIGTIKIDKKTDEIVELNPIEDKKE